MTSLSQLFSSVYPCAATTADGYCLHILSQGNLGPLIHVMLVDDIRHNRVSVSPLCDIGMVVCIYFQYLMRYLWGMFEIYLGKDYVDLFLLTRTNTDTDMLDLWHPRLGDTSHRVTREAVKKMLLEGIMLDRKYFNLKSIEKLPVSVCYSLSVENA